MNEADVISYLANLPASERKALFLKASTLYRKQAPLKVGDVCYLDVDLLEEEQRITGETHISHYQSQRDDIQTVIAVNGDGTYHIEGTRVYMGKTMPTGVWRSCKREYLLLRE